MFPFRLFIGLVIFGLFSSPRRSESTEPHFLAHNPTLSKLSDSGYSGDKIRTACLTSSGLSLSGLRRRATGGLSMPYSEYSLHREDSPFSRSLLLLLLTTRACFVSTTVYVDSVGQGGQGASCPGDISSLLD